MTRDAAELMVQNHYYCDAEHQERVLALRRQASRCRADLGLPPGLILQRVGGSESAPWVIWQQGFDSLDAWTADLDVLTASDEFTAIRAQQTAALRHFDRAAYRPVATELG